MASANISFDKIPASTRKPGVYAEWNLKRAMRNLPTNRQRVLLIAQHTTDLGAVSALTDVYSAAEVAERYGVGSQAHLMADAAITRPIMDWRKVMEQNAVVYVGLDALTDAEVAAAVGNAMFADLTSLAGQIYKHGHGYGQSGPTKKRMVAIHADEFNELIGNEFIPMLNKAGGAGYQVTAYTQTWSDVEAKIGSKAKAEQMGGNFNTMIMLRVKLESTAKMLTSQLPDVRVVTGTLVSGAGDVAFPEGYEDFTSHNEDRLSSETVPMLMPSDLTNLPKGQAFALLEGGNLYKLRLPLPLPDPTADIPQSLTDMAERMRETVRLSRNTEEEETVFIEGRSYG